MTDPDLVGVVVLDVDGTLVDTTYLHVQTWAEAFESVGVEVAWWRVHRSIGMGGDHLVATVAGDQVERDHGDDLRERQKAGLTAHLDRVRPLPGAQELMEKLRRRGIRVVVASSGAPEITDQLLRLAGGEHLVEERTTSGDVESSKPSPEAVEVALERIGGGRAVVVGDATWDMEAARRAGHHPVGVRSGGIAAAELREAGAEQVYDDLADLLAHLDDLPLAVNPSATAPST